MGYAYAGAFKARAAYDHSCEVTIYLDRKAKKCGLGRLLYEALEKELKDMGILNLYACIACPIGQDDTPTLATKRQGSFIGAGGNSDTGTI